MVSYSPRQWDAPFTPEFSPFKPSLSHRRNSSEGSWRRSSTFVAGLLVVANTLRLTIFVEEAGRGEVVAAVVEGVLLKLLLEETTWAALGAEALPLGPMVVQPPGASSLATPAS